MVIQLVGVRSQFKLQSILNHSKCSVHTTHLPIHHVPQMCLGGVCTHRVATSLPRLSYDLPRWWKGASYRHLFAKHQCLGYSAVRVLKYCSLQAGVWEKSIPSSHKEPRNNSENQNMTRNTSLTRLYTKPLQHKPHLTKKPQNHSQQD